MCFSVIAGGLRMDLALEDRCCVCVSVIHVGSTSSLPSFPSLVHPWANIFVSARPNATARWYTYYLIVTIVSVEQLVSTPIAVLFATLWTACPSGTTVLLPMWDTHWTLRRQSLEGLLMPALLHCLACPRTRAP